MKKLVLAAMLFLFLPLNAMAISIYFDPSSTIADVGDTFTIDIFANFEDEAVLGWGLDLSYDTTVLSLESTTIGPIWTPAPSFDGDGLAGAAFPSTISGNNILLATIDFEVMNYGATTISASYSIGDLTEGFALVPIGSFAQEVEFSSATATAPVPEPATMVLLGTGLFGIGVFSRKRKKNS